MKIFTVVVTLVFSLFVVVSIHAQVAGATLSGTVTDASHAAVPNASVSIRNKDTGVARDVTTNDLGFYSAPNLSPGTYDVTVTAPGFSKQVQTGIPLAVGAQQLLNIPMQVGQVSQQVEVTAEAPAVELTSSAITAQVDSNTVRELPLNGRDWSSLSVLQPGVIGIRTQQGTTGTVNRGNRGFGNQLSVAGHRPTENNYRVNGVTVNDYSNGSPGSVAGSQLGVDAIQEFSVLTANYTAEYGRTSGGVINAITKPGTNSFHGDAYWFLRDEGLDARNFFDPAKLPPFHRNQFGGSAGGPIQKGKTFIFGDYEGIRQVKSLTSNTNVLSPAARGIGPNGQPAVAVVNGQPLPASGPNAAPNPDPVTHIDTAVKPYLAFFPLPNGTVGTDTGKFLTSLPQQYSQNFVTARADHHFSEKDDIDAVWFYDRSPQLTPDAFLLSTTGTFSERVMAGLEETHTFRASLVNTARVGFNRTIGFVGQLGTALLPVAGDNTLGVDGKRPAPILNIIGITTMQGSLGSQTRNNHYQNSFQFYDDAFLIHGSHSLKFGFAVERLQYNELSIQRPNGTFNFADLTSFLTNHPSSLPFLGDPTFRRELGTRTTFFGGYVQDDWHARSNLTLNIGLRYEMATLPTEAGGADFSVAQCLSCAPVYNALHPWATNSTRRNFEPRIGFAWDPFRNGKTSVRGGFGIFDVLPGPWVVNIQESGSFPFSRVVGNGNLSPGDFPSKAAANLGASTTSYQAYAPDQNPKRNYAMNWNLNIQREINSSLTVMVGYVGSHTVHSPFTTDSSNMVAPPNVTVTTAGGGDLWPCGPNGTAGVTCAVGFLPTGTQANPVPSPVLNPNVGALRPTSWSVSSHYSGLEAQLTKKMSHGLQAQGSFTWGKCIDSGSSGDIGDAYQNSMSSTIFFAPGNRNGLCDFQVGKNFVGNFIWEVPAPKSGSAVLSHVAGGWELGGILTASTGTPFTVLMGGDPLGQKNGDAFDIPNRVVGCNPINPNWRKDPLLQFVNLSCFTPPTAPASMAAQCATGSFPSAAPAPSGQVYCANLIGNAGRNQLIGPGIVNMDFSVFKNNYIRRISESFNVQFRAEIFNVANHANFQSPINNETLFNGNGSLAGSGGTPDVTSTEPRQIQFGLKVIW